MISVVLIGLGQVAWRFDEEGGRPAVWTHLGAYKTLEHRIEVTGAYDPSPEARSDFAERHPEVPLYESITDLMKACQPDVVSICAPNDMHRDAISEAFKTHVPRVIWCEKPLATNSSDAADIADLCAENNVFLLVSYVRRWHPVWRRFKERIGSGEIGRLRSLRVAMPNRLWSIGSHALDLTCWLGGQISETQALPLSELAEDGEPAVSAMFVFESGASGLLHVTGMKKNLVIEAEAIGDEGRLYCSEGRSTISVETFKESKRYLGYRELDGTNVETVEVSGDHSPFVAIAKEILDTLDGTLTVPTCTPESALLVQNLLEYLSKAANQPQPSTLSNNAGTFTPLV